MPYLRIRPCWLPQTRQLRDPAPYFLGWEFHTLSCAIFFLPHLEGFARRWSSCALTTGSTRPYVACVDPSATSCPAMRPPFASQKPCKCAPSSAKAACLCHVERKCDGRNDREPPPRRTAAFLARICTERGRFPVEDRYETRAGVHVLRRIERRFTTVWDRG